MVEISVVVGLVGGLIGVIAGAYTLLEKLWLNRPKLTYEVLRHGITNYYHDMDNPEKGGYSDVEILLSLSNSGGGILGIGKILVKSKDEKYPIAVATHKYENGRKGEIIRSFTLSKNECKELLLSDRIGLFKGKKLDVEIEIYDSRFKIMEKILVELYPAKVPASLISAPLILHCF